MESGWRFCKAGTKGNYPTESGEFFCLIVPLSSLVSQTSPENQQKQTEELKLLETKGSNQNNFFYLQYWMGRRILNLCKFLIFNNHPFYFFI